MKRREETGIEWPDDLASWDLAQWGDDVAHLGGRPAAWSRWCDARYEHLRGLRYAPGGAQYLAVGDFRPGIDRE